MAASENAYVYMLRCADGSLYSGWTSDVQRRLAAHNAGTASRCTRARRPVALVYLERRADRGDALANTLGVVVGLATALTPLRDALLWIDRRL